MFNLVYTSLPIIVFGLCEQNVEAKVYTVLILLILCSTPEPVYKVAICPRGNVPYIRNYPINYTVFNLMYPVGSSTYLPNYRVKSLKA